jgi:hypothetical protein
MRALIVVAVVLLPLLPTSDAACDAATDCKSCATQGCTWCLSSNVCGTAAELLLQCSSANRVTDAFTCPISPPAGSEYDEPFVRNIVTGLIAASNGQNEQEVQTCLNNQVAGAQLVRYYRVVCDADGDYCTSYLAIDHTRRAIMTIFRGSDGFLQLISQGFAFLTSMTNFPCGGKVISYYNDAFFHVWNNGMGADVLALKAANPTYQLWSFGHSLGGALASVCANYLVCQGTFATADVRLVTYGQPRTGNEDNAKTIYNNVPYRIRVVHNNDIVPSLPPRFGGDPATHHRWCVSYRNDMAEGQPYTLALMNEDSQCGGTGLLSTNDHGFYYNRQLSTWVQNGCT